MTKFDGQSCDIEICVRYAEVDRMGALHHSRYWVYFEMGRTELLRTVGVPYSRLESQGVFFVVAKCTARFMVAGHYDDTLILTTRVTRLGRARIDHSYELKRPSDGMLLTTAQTTLACVDRQGKLMAIPDFVRTAHEWDQSKGKDDNR